MPPSNPNRTIDDEDNLARRIRYERGLRGWSYEHLAQRLTSAGCAIQGSAIYKIEKAQPRRRVTVNELVAFARVFNLDAGNLLKPVDLLGDREAEKLTDRWLALQTQITSDIARADELADQLAKLAKSGALREFPVYQFLNSGLFKMIRKAEDNAAAAASLFLHDRTHERIKPDPRTAILIARARAGEIDNDGRALPTTDDNTDQENQ